jgi:hypothetical protein
MTYRHQQGCIEFGREGHNKGTFDKEIQNAVTHRC